MYIEAVALKETDAVILQAICSLQRHPSNPWKQELGALLDRAEAGEDVTVEIIDLLRLHENVRLWMQEQIAESDACFRIAGFDPLPGDTGSIPASNSWICPRKKCTKSLPVIQEGEDPPACEVHQITMVRRRS